jgi:hypothetical protein
MTSHVVGEVLRKSKHNGGAAHHVKRHPREVKDADAAEIERNAGSPIQMRQKGGRKSCFRGGCHAGGGIPGWTVNRTTTVELSNVAVIVQQPTAEGVNSPCVYAHPEEVDGSIVFGALNWAGAAPAGPERLKWTAARTEGSTSTTASWGPSNHGS